jgi:hypothetical protein
LCPCFDDFYYAPPSFLGPGYPLQAPALIPAHAARCGVYPAEGGRLSASIAGPVSFKKLTDFQLAGRWFDSDKGIENQVVTESDCRY